MTKKPTAPLPSKFSLFARLPCHAISLSRQVLVVAPMSDSILKIIVPLFVSVLFAATSTAQSATPVAVVEDFLKAWNSHDVKAFDRLVGRSQNSTKAHNGSPLQGSARHFSPSC